MGYLTDGNSEKAKLVCGPIDEVDGYYNDPHAIALLIKKIKVFLKLGYHDDVKLKHCRALQTASNYKITYHAARNSLRKDQIGTIVPRIYFLGSDVLSSYTEVLGLGSWLEFRKSVNSIVTDLPNNPPNGSTAPQAHVYYQEKVYREWKNKIERALGEVEIPISEIVGKKQIHRESVSMEGTGMNWLGMVDDHEEEVDVLSNLQKQSFAEIANTLVSSKKPLAIIGMAGVGKSEFIQYVLKQPLVKETYKYRFVVYCNQDVTFNLFLSSLSRVVLGISQDGREDLERDLFEYLNRLPGKKLIVIESFENLYENYFWETVQFVKALQTAVTVIYTMRSYVGPQKLDVATYLIPELGQADAIKLFHYYSNEKFLIDQENQKFVEYFVGDRVAGGLPLAIRLLAKRARASYSLADLYEEWSLSGIELMKIEDSLDKDWNMIASISFSFNSPRLRQEDKALLKALSELPSSIQNGCSVLRNCIKDGYSMVGRLLEVALVSEDKRGTLVIHPTVRNFMKRQVIPSNDYLESISKFYLNLVIIENHLGRKKRISMGWYKREDWDNCYYAVLQFVNSERGLNLTLDRVFKAGVVSTLIAANQKASELGNESDVFYFDLTSDLSTLSDYIE